MTVDTHSTQTPDAPAFRKRCRCSTSPLSFQVTPPGGEARSERLCSVCAAQLEHLGYKVARR